MRKTAPLALLSFTFIFVFTSCWSFYKDRNHTENGLREEAYVPIYGIDTAYRTIRSMAPQPIIESGKIYVLGSNLFQVEKNKGVHIINYSDKTKPVKIGFIRSGGASEVAVKNGYLVVNNGPDLVTIDISNYTSVKEIARVKNAFKTFYSDAMEYNQPTEKGKYYVCPIIPPGQDLIGWKLQKDVENANCFTFP